MVAMFALASCNDNGPRYRAVPGGAAHANDTGLTEDAEVADDAGIADDAGTDAGLSENAPPPNNFAGFETWDLHSGMRVWIKRIKGAPTVRIQVALPVGSAEDPKGVEGLAHLVEHLVFIYDSDETEDKPLRHAHDRGGISNGITTKNETYYYVDLPSSEWAYGVRWMYDLLWGHEFQSASIGQVREVNIAEGNLQPQTVGEKLQKILSPAWMELPDFYEREFGFDQQDADTNGTYESLHRIGPSATRFFHDTFYTPKNMLLTVIGDVPEEEAEKLILETFGKAGLEKKPKGESKSSGSKKGMSSIEARYEIHRKQLGLERGTPLSKHKIVVDPGRFRREVDFDSDAALVSYRLRYKLYDVTAEDVVKLGFIENLLDEAVEDTLRYELNSTYSSEVEVQYFGGHGLFDVGADILPKKFEEGRHKVEGLVSDLRSGRMKPARFEALKKRAIDELLLDTQSPQSLSRKTLDFLDRRQFPEFPDLVAAWRGMTQADVADYCSRRLVQNRLVERITRPETIPTPILGFATLLLFVLFARGLKRIALKPALVHRIQYLAKFRFSLLYLVVFGLLTLCAELFVARILNSGRERVFNQLLVGWDCDIGRNAIAIVLDGVLWCSLLAIPMFIPRKILLFEHEWRVKFWLWRSKVYRYEDIQEMREERFWKLLFSRRIFTSLVLHWGLWRNGVYLRTGKRFSWFLRARDNAELMKMLELGKRGWVDVEPDIAGSKAGPAASTIPSAGTPAC
jgi:predicted Zn-dependent peptidase